MRTNSMRAEGQVSVEFLTALTARVLEVPYRRIKIPATYFSVFPEVISIAKYCTALRTCHLCHD